MTARKVGLTGGIACGKSVVSGHFADLGAAVVDADRIAREVVEPGSEGLAAVVRHFSDAVLRADGSLDRAKLAEIVFSDPAERRALDAIVHPRIRALSRERIESLARSSAPIVLYDAALLFETGIYRQFDRNIVVHCSRAAQLARLMRRDRFTRAEALRRIRAQAPLEEKLAIADDTICTDGTPADTRARATELFRRLARRD